MVKNSKRKSVLITGAVGDIGQAICKKYFDEGFFVIGIDKVNEPHKYIDKFIQCDLNDFSLNEESQNNIYDSIHSLNEINPLGVLINAAAVQILGSLENIDINSIQTTLNINVVAPMILSKLFFKLLANSHGCIINIGSIHANLTKPGFINYATSKSALSGLTKSMAIELAELGVRVNCIEPAAIDTKMLKEGFTGNPESMRLLEKAHPMNRIGKPEEVAELSYYLSSEAAGFITGVSIRLDGGIGVRLHDPL
jgi:gluconate 5-dehydrogenase